MSDLGAVPEIRERVFQRLWGVATIAHLAGNAHGPDIWPAPTPGGFVLLLCGIAATICIIRPSRTFFTGLCVLIPLSAVAEVPFLGNHWLLAAIVSLTWLACRARWSPFENAARLVLLSFYAWAAFAKLNAGFFDTTTSCAVYYSNQMLTEFGLGELSPSSAMASLSIWGSAVIELAVVPLLIWSKTRRAGLLLALGFHGFLTLDFAQHFYDFTSVLFALFLLFASNEVMETLESHADRLKSSTWLIVLIFVIGVGTSVGSVLVSSAGPRNALADVTFLWWLPLLGAIWLAALRGRAAREIRWRLGPVAIAGMLVVCLNGLTPYTEIKTTFGWNMYSNLVVIDGESNHFLMPDGMTLRDGHDGLVEVVESSDPALQAYADKKYLLPWPSFRQLVSQKPAARVVFRRHGKSVEVARIDAEPDWMEPPPWWWKWLPLRSVHRDSPQRCQSSALPGL